MKSRKKDELKTGVLAERMDVGTEEFNEFQAVILNKSRENTEKQKRKIELLAIRFRMEDYLNSNSKDIVQAGEFLKDFLKITHVRQNRFADYIGVKPSNLNKLIGGERPINHELAIILGKIFNVEPILWLKIQAKNELIRIARQNKDKFMNYSLDDLVNG